MLAEIEHEVAQTKGLLGRDRLDPRVAAAVGAVPRHEFVPAHEQSAAYDNRPLSIGYGQTISQPYIVAIMTELAAPQAGDTVLEVGTGCGYQTAILAELAARVFSIETVPELAADAEARLRRLGYGNIAIRTGDGTQGWPEAAPFDAILVAAAAQKRVPPALIAQLAPGGRLVIPLQRGLFRLSFGLWPEQELLLITKDPAGTVTEKAVLPVAFVPLVERRRGKPTG